VRAIVACGLFRGKGRIMASDTFVQRTRIAAPASAVFAWHMRPGALERLTPPWERVTVLERAAEIAEGSRVVLRVPVGPLGLRWVAVHRNIVPGRQFCDEQIDGPFARWVHTHTVEPDGSDACVLEDRIEYRLPLGTVGRLAGGAITRAKLRRMFAYRHATIAADLAAHASWPATPLTVAVTGTRGLLGSSLVPFLTTAGHRVIRLVRGRPADPSEVAWSAEAAAADPARLEGVDAVVHLAGENIAAGRWTEARKDEIRRSRVEGTRRLAAQLAGLRRPPKSLVCASAVGYYGHRGPETLTDAAPPGRGFLADVCQEWEAAAEPARQAGIRVVHMRLGVVLSPAGGALAKMLLPFRLGLGGRIGSGEQFLSWISLDDAVGAFTHALQTPALAGAVNTVSPAPVPNKEFSRLLAKTLGRPALFPLPAALLRLALAEMADALLLASTRAVPTRLLAAGYRFRHTKLEEALRHLLGR
jgi:hypothetical protein